MDGKFRYLKQQILSHAIPEPQLLVKDHKLPDETGTYLTHLVIPVTSFSASFLKIAYKGTPKLFDDNSVNYSKYTITQASELKEAMERQYIDPNKVTVMSFDIVYMYPSTHLSLIKRLSITTLQNYQ
jgi:hypothetical protein